MSHVCRNFTYVSYGYRLYVDIYGGGQLLICHRLYMINICCIIYVLYGQKYSGTGIYVLYGQTYSNWQPVHGIRKVEKP